MASPEVLDFESLLAPIPGENPAGTDPRADPSPVADYHTIRSARKAASDQERRIDQGDDAAAPPDWKSVVLDRSKKLVAGKAKDLEITAYLIEALVRVHGFAGLRDGFRLARGLVERFWEGLFPDPGDTDYESRFSHIFWLSGIDRPGTLIVPVRKIAFTGRANDANYGLAHYQMAQALIQVVDPKVRERKIAEGAITVEMIQQAVGATPPGFYASLMDDLNAGREEFRTFCAVLNEKSQYDPPGSDLLGVLETYHDVVTDLARDKIPKAAPPPVPEAAQVAGAAGETRTSVPAGGSAAILDRDDALERLARVAAYFRENEPQSIIPYALGQVIAWGRMPLPELLAELIPDDGPRQSLFKQVGIKAQDSHSV